MFSIRKINPMVRAVGTMGAVAALAGGITFATTGLTSNTVALTPNNLTTATATLAIGAGTSCPTTTTSTTGLQDSSLAPGGSTSVPFCLDNTGGVPMILSVSIPDNLTGSTAAADTTLTITCPTEGTLSTTLSTWSNGTSYAFPTALPAGSADNCTATAVLSSSYAGSGGEVIPAFSIDFIGNQST
jgi:hypothetical protein